MFDDVAPWPETSAPAPKDHNRPPPEEIVPLEFREALLADRPDFMEWLDNYLGFRRVGHPDDEEIETRIAGVVDRASATDDETFGKCGEVVKALRRAEQHVNATHKIVKAPYLEAGRLVDAEKNMLVARINEGGEKVVALMNAYAAKKRKAEQEAAAKADAERKRLEDLARREGIKAALPPPAPVRKAEPVRSDGGATVSTSIEYVGVVEDYAKAFRKVKDDAAVREAIDKAIQRLVKAAKGKIALPGVRIDEHVKTIAR